MSNEERPYFTVVIPAYNAAAFIAEALLSVQSQSFADFECFVVNDGSTDATADEALPFMTDSRFRLISTGHSGVPAHARNVGIREATGRYVAFLDADDAWPLDKLAVFHSHIERTGAAVVYSNALTVDRDLRPLRRYLGRRLKRSVRLRDPLLLVRNLVAASTAVVDRELLAEAPFDEDPAIRGTEDYELWVRLNTSHTFHYIAEPLLYYRQHENQISTRARFTDNAQVVLNSPAIVAAYGPENVALALDLFVFRSARLQGDIGGAVRQTLRIARWFSKPERTTLIEYLTTLGLLERGMAKARGIFHILPAVAATGDRPT